ncbi:hypothetical protein [Brevibacterium atlanticum]|uniref:hypothetical protein n=1 Tax=Brevibacterium atlanticum TaxID=2697563 RepID=UPI001421EEB7|nr:hypothetical protein [Brevibacterium atlanticum]
MAEEQFTSRRARREAERLAAEQAFEAQEVPEQPNEAPNPRADLLSPLPPKKPDAVPRAKASGDESDASDDGRSSRIDPNPAPRTSHERGALASDHPVETRPPVQAEDRLDPQRTPLPHFESRAEKKRYLKQHGLSLNGDLSTGAMPVVADEQELAERQAAAEGRLTGPVPEVVESTGDDDAAVSSSAPGEQQTSAAEAPEAKPSAGKKPSKRVSTSTKAADAKAATTAEKTEAAAPAADPAQTEHESYDAAGFGGASDEVAARDFEAPVTPTSAPRPTTLDDEPYDALSMPYSALDGTDPKDRSSSTSAEPEAAAQATADKGGAEPARSSGSADDSASSTLQPTSAQQSTPDSAAVPNADDAEPASRSRRMPIVQPPSTSGVRVVTAASAQIPEVDDSRGSAPNSPSNRSADAAPSTPTAGDGAATGRSATDDGAATGSDDAARALAANPETRPMDAVPEAWALPNSDYEDEETENPPGNRIRASSVTGHDGQILMGEEPSKMPYIVLGVAAFFALALIVIALVMFL